MFFFFFIFCLFVVFFLFFGGFQGGPNPPYLFFLFFVCPFLSLSSWKTCFHLKRAFFIFECPPLFLLSFFWPPPFFTFSFSFSFSLYISLSLSLFLSLSLSLSVSLSLSFFSCLSSFLFFFFGFILVPCFCFFFIFAFVSWKEQHQTIQLQNVFVHQSFLILAGFLSSFSFKSPCLIFVFSSFNFCFLFNIDVFFKNAKKKHQFLVKRGDAT